VAYLPGAFLLVVLLVPPAAVLIRLRARGRRGSAAGRDGGDGLAAWAIWLTAVALLAAPAATAAFDYRYVLPAAPLACLAAALTVVRGLPGARQPSPDSIKTRDNQALL
jgi:hypothetical protein